NRRVRPSRTTVTTPGGFESAKPGYVLRRCGGLQPSAPRPGEPQRRFALKIRLCRAALVVAALVLTTGASAAATSSVTITSPRAGQSVSLKKNPYLAVAGTV